MWLLVYSTLKPCLSSLENPYNLGQKSYACNVYAINVALRSIEALQRQDEGYAFRLVNAVFIPPNTDPALLERADVIVVEPLLHDAQQQQQT